MKISSLQENLKNSLIIAGHVAGKNVNLPILSNVMIEARDGNIKLIATDLEIGIVCSMRGKIEKEGVFTVESKTISDFVALLPNKRIDIKKKDSRLLIECENYKTVINGQESDEFPLIPKVDKENFYKAEIDEFRKALSQVVFAVSNSETRIELSGVLFDFNKEKLVMAATDSYRLAEKEIKIKSNSDDLKRIIVPGKTLHELVRILSAIRSEEIGDEKKEISFFVSDNQIMFSVGNVELISRLIEGQYPDYKQIIPTNAETKAVVNRDDLIRAVKASSIFSKVGVNDINLDFPLNKNKIVISSESGQTGESVTELDANVGGKDNGLVVNYKYLLDGINVIDNDNVKMNIIDSNTPCVLKPENEDSYLYIIMPIKQ